MKHGIILTSNWYTQVHQLQDRRVLDRTEGRGLPRRERARNAAAERPADQRLAREDALLRQAALEGRESGSSGGRSTTPTLSPWVLVEGVKSNQGLRRFALSADSREG